ncbi:hypothetical protein J2Z53_001470 [Clostridium moniliforme]|uniref:Uncharacterized protein n=1 Tax=Clostridium moniliforme TaxID=39489 RepID=A0ABS4F0X4_9CLOT|nr:hypothetical protein [Clostridium moniliforme]MBP1889887.1 hypothetical protein [Clostridium moniliforme]
MSFNYNLYAEKRIDDAECYIDIKGKDIRLAVQKMNNLYSLISIARISLEYSNKKCYSKNDENSNFVRYVHIKNAILNLNSIYDVSLQVIWFLYRVWNKYDILEFSCEDRKKAKKIKRNGEFWIDNAENLCSYKYIIKYLKNSEIKEENELGDLLEEFKDKFLFNNKKKFTVRALCNFIKHKGDILVKELNKGTKLEIQSNIKIGRDVDILLKCNNDEFPKIKIKKFESILVDIIYSNNAKSEENFYGKDLIRRIYTLDEIILECNKYLENFYDIYDKNVKILSKHLIRNPFFRESKVGKSINVNIDKYFLD